jgi:DNA recombination protein Rad52
MTAFTQEQINALSAKLDAANVKKNPKGFDYIEGWHAISEANRIFGFDGWNREIVSLAQVAEPYEVNGKKRVAYRATVRITVFAEGKTIIRDGTGYGSGIGQDLNDAHESAVKEAETDAMKRALMTFGNPFGLALYDKTKADVERAPPPQPKGSTSYHIPVPLNIEASGSDWKAWANLFKEAIRHTKSPAEVQAILNSNKDSLDTLKTVSESAYKHIEGVWNAAIDAMTRMAAE